jgi:hypothetical protein
MKRFSKMKFVAPGAREKRRPAKPVVVLPLQVIENGRMVVWPIHTVSEANVSSEHWAAKGRRVGGQRAAAALLARATLDKPRHWPVVVTVCRLAPARNRIRDAHENYPMAFKHVVDGIADWLGVNDGDRTKVQWVYAPEEASSGFGVRVEIRALAQEGGS